MTTELPQLLSDLADLIRRIAPERYAAPTPCPDYDVAALRSHVLGWLPVFATALSDPDGAAPRPDPESRTAPDDPVTAAAEVLDAAKLVTAALDDGVAGRPVALLGDTPLPGSMVVNMLTAEVIGHGWDLARATGLPWTPSPVACEDALAGMRGMLSPEYRGEGRAFAAEVAVPEDAGPLERLLGFSGRDPRWTPLNR